jgi:N-acetyl-gamma-glutamyl-phosphate reductase
LKEVVARIPALVIGGSGYVAGEVLRLLAGHPRLQLAAALSESQAGEPVVGTFPHLAGAVGADVLFTARPDLAATLDRLPARGPLAIFSAAPHGASAALVDETIALAERLGFAPRAVDLSADFRFPSAADYEAVYRKPHGAPARLAEFASVLPEHVAGAPARHIGHPGCFTTAATLATLPLVALDLAEPRFSVVAVTGSTGGGRTPTPRSHHPERRSTLSAYDPFTHRHAAEMRGLVERRTGSPVAIDFLPHSGPFARGIHATILGRMSHPLPADEVAGALAAFYAEAPFVRVSTAPPALQSVVGTNHCRIGVATNGSSLALFSVLDNLVKGAAGGGVQWMNRLLGCDETDGLLQPGLGWL